MIKFPELRKELIDYIIGLSDIEYQNQCWVNGNCPEGIVNDEFDYAIHFLFDDTELSSNPKSLIGYFLKNETEALLIYKLCQDINYLFHKYGMDLSDEEYINCTHWNNIVISATHILNYMRPI